MATLKHWMWTVGIVGAGALVPGVACNGSETTAGTGGAGGSTTSQGGNGTGGGNGGATGGTTNSGGTTSSGGGGSATGGSGGLAPPTSQVQCSNKLYECGDLIDNDNDGLVDYQDPDCLGPCDNTEDSFYPDLPGGSGINCDLDCFWDTGNGHDELCYWDHHCDPHSDLANNAVANPQPDCSWNSNTQGSVDGQSFPPSPYTCAQMYATQPQTCLDTCKPLTPNGCDCFGCCQLGGQYVWIGSVLDGTNTGTCTLASIGSPTFLEDCHPCVPVPGCDNTCELCELCIGKPTLPPECYGAGGSGGSGGAPQDCPLGQQPCGLPGQAPCAAGSYCITGCCILAPN